ncbi:MAG TPA: TadE family protein, partial [Candidatus Elarobacter sp.]
MSSSRRGAALPETALVLTLMLAILVGAMRLALIGYEQASVDGAAFYSAHQNAVKNSDPSVAASLDPVAATHTAFPRSNSQVIAPPTMLPAPTSQDQQVLNSGYGFNDGQDRHGGVSMIQPMQTLSTVSRSGLSSLTLFNGGSIMVSGVGVDPSYVETGVHGDISGNNFNTTAMDTSATDYFTQGEN